MNKRVSICYSEKNYASKIKIQIGDYEYGP